MSTPHDGPDADHIPPDGVTDATVAAVGRLTEALETLDRARGHLYSLHELVGAVDRGVREAISEPRHAGRDEQADRLDTELVGRNVMSGRWTFQIVEDFDDGYWSTFRAHERRVRDELAGGKRHLLEAQQKEQRRTPGQPGTRHVRTKTGHSPDREQGGGEYVTASRSEAAARLVPAPQGGDVDHARLRSFSNRDAAGQQCR